MKYFYKLNPFARGTGFVTPDGFTDYDPDTPPAEFLKEIAAIDAQQITAHIKAYRKQREIGGFTFNGVNIETDEKSERRIIGASVKAYRDPNYKIDNWGTDNGFISLSNAQLIAIGDAFDDHLQKCFSAQATVEVAHATTPYTSISAIETAFDNAYNS